MEKIYKKFLGKKTSAYDLIGFFEKELSFKFTAPININQILDQLELKYSQKPDFKNIKIDGKITIENSEPLIWCNPMKLSIEERKRFTLAHELGHFMLHIAPTNNLNDNIGFKDENISFNRDNNWNTNEMEANAFASQLLMPANLIKEELKNLLTSEQNVENKKEVISKLSNIFFVSETAMKFRLKSMGVNL